MQIMFLYTGVGSALIFVGLVLRYKKFKDDENELKAVHENFIEMKNLKNKENNERDIKIDRKGGDLDKSDEKDDSRMSL